MILKSALDGSDDDTLWRDSDGVENGSSKCKDDECTEFEDQ
jgi:hypothetical protein